MAEKKGAKQQQAGYQAGIDAYRPYNAVGQAGMQSLAQALGVNVDPAALGYGGAPMVNSAVPPTGSLASMVSRAPQALTMAKDPLAQARYLMDRQKPEPGSTPKRSLPSGSQASRSSYRTRGAV